MRSPCNGTSRIVSVASAKAAAGAAKNRNAAAIKSLMTAVTPTKGACTPFLPQGCKHLPDKNLTKSQPASKVFTERHGPHGDEKWAIRPMDLGEDCRNNFPRMSRLLSRKVLVVRMTLALAIVILAFTATGATSATPAAQQCNWGASSVTAWVDADGTVHQSEPATTGCIP